MKLSETATDIFSSDYSKKAQSRLTDIYRILKLLKQGLRLAERNNNQTAIDEITAQINDFEEDKANLEAQLGSSTFNLGNNSESDNKNDSDSDSDSTEEDEEETDDEEVEEETDEESDVEDEESEDDESEEESDTEINDTDNSESEEDTEESEEDTEESDNTSTDEESETEKGTSEENGSSTGETEDSEENGQDTDSDDTNSSKTSDSKNSSDNDKSVLSDEVDQPSGGGTSNSEAVIDPFRDSPAFGSAGGQLGGGGAGGQTNLRMPTADEIVTMLKDLKGESKRGILDGLTELLNKINQNNTASAESAPEEMSEALTEGKVPVMDYSDDNWANKINKAINTVNKIGKVNIVQDGPETRAQKIKSELTDPDILNKITNEINDEVRATRPKVTAATAKQSTGVKPVQNFPLDLQKAVVQQIKNVFEKEPSYSALSKRGTQDGTVRKGEKSVLKKSPNVPVIDVFIDQSGSYNDTLVQKAFKLLEAIRLYEKRKQIVINEYYFANGVYRDAASARAEGGTQAWPEILDTIEADKAANVIIISDDDLDDQGQDRVVNGQHIRASAKNYEKTVVVPGCVWLLWGYRRAHYVQKRLLGKQSRGSIEYTFN